MNSILHFLSKLNEDIRFNMIIIIYASCICTYDFMNENYIMSSFAAILVIALFLQVSICGNENINSVKKTK